MNDIVAFGITVLSMLVGMITTAILTWLSDKLYDCSNKTVCKIAQFIYELMDEMQWGIIFIISIFIMLILGCRYYK